MYLYSGLLINFLMNNMFAPPVGAANAALSLRLICPGRPARGGANLAIRADRGMLARHYRASNPSRRLNAALFRRFAPE
jgi:hypothetical protein